MKIDAVTRFLVAITLADGSGKQLEALLSNFESIEQLSAVPLNELINISRNSRSDFINRLVIQLRDTNIDNLLTHWSKAGIYFIGQNNDKYPQQFFELYDPPVGFYYRGNPDLLSTLSVAIVGTRNATKYGSEQAYKLAHNLAELGVTLVSGLAAGIDSAAHAGSLEAYGDNIAVLGSGVEQTLVSQQDLYRKIIDRGGCIISEYPVGFKATKWSFPRRNRLIGALAQATVVIEAPIISGALITAHHANELGREVLAMPGPVTYESYHGCHELIRKGAALYENINDVLISLGLDKSVMIKVKYDALESKKGLLEKEQIGTQNEVTSDLFQQSLPVAPKIKKITKNNQSENVNSLQSMKDLPTSNQQGYPDLSEEEKETLAKVSYDMTHINDLAKEQKLTVSKISGILTILEINGYITSLSGGFFKRIA